MIWYRDCDRSWQQTRVLLTTLPPGRDHQPTGPGGIVSFVQYAAEQPQPDEASLSCA